MKDFARYVSRVANDTYRHSRPIMPEQPWWDNLDPLFHQYPDDFDLDLVTQLMVRTTAGIDRVSCALLSSLTTLTAMPRTMHPARLNRDLAQTDYYGDIAIQRDPERFFPKPSQKVTVRRRKASLLEYRPSEGRVEVLSFKSEFEPQNPALRTAYQAHKRNSIAWAEHWCHGDKPRPTLCMIHGFVADPYWLNSRWLALPWFYKQGYDILLYTLPFHGRRQGMLDPFSGYGYFAHGFSHLNETIAHAVHDFRLFLDYLEEQGCEQFGVTGISLGGYTSALLAAVEPRLAFAIPNVPVISLVDLMLQWRPIGLALRMAMRANGVSVHDLRRLTAVSNPLTYDPLLDKSRLMIIGAAGDRFAPPKHSRLLWDHWQQPELHWFPGNHLIHLDQGRYLKQMASFMRAQGF
ncbi:MAG: alpha/beta hydrolase family protein [Marinobacter sp.]|nr:alpha/beta hydrolase family protein [Marinobacter sp.]